MVSRKLALFALLAILSLHTKGFAVEPSENIFYVATNGNDAWSGRRAEPTADGTDGPFATLERARDAIRALRQDGQLPPGGAVVEVAGGVYRVDGPLTLTSNDSGSGAAPIVYRAREGEEVRWTGGVVVTNFEPVTDPTIRKRLDPAARDHVLVADLRALGVTEFGDAGGGGIELFFDDEPMTVARWPNEGFVKIVGLVGGDPVDVRGTKGDRIGKFYYEGDRPKRWKDENDVWVHGYWFWDWADQRHHVASIDTEKRIIEVEPPYHGYGYRVGQWFYAYNVLAELDRPGEWYLDREVGKLYFWPPKPIAEAQAVVSVAKSLLTMENVSHITVRGFTFEAARGTAITIRDSEDVRIVKSTIRNVYDWAVRVDGGKRVGVVGSDLYGMGHGGIALNGGDRKTLTPAEHYADNNDIYEYSRWKRMYQPAIMLNGVGNRATHNRIHDAPHMAIGFGGNEHLIEYNEIYNVSYESNDAGAIYSGRDWTWRGTMIRYNYLHDITGFENKGCVGVYLDDMLSGITIFGNVFYNVTRAAFIGGGRDNVVENNLFVDCKPALHIDGRALGWAKDHIATTMTERLQAMPYRESPWKERYPELLTLLDDEPGAPKGNVVARNISVGGRWDEIYDNIRDLVRFEGNLVDQDPGFVGTPPGSFELREDSPAYKLGFKRIPFEKIGLYDSEDRVSPPTRGNNADE